MDNGRTKGKDKDKAKDREVIGGYATTSEALVE